MMSGNLFSHEWCLHHRDLANVEHASNCLLKAGKRFEHEQAVATFYAVSSAFVPFVTNDFLTRLSGMNKGSGNYEVLHVSGKLPILIYHGGILKANRSFISALVCIGPLFESHILELKLEGYYAWGPLFMSSPDKE